MDKETIIQIKSGNKLAFKKLYDQYGDYAIRVAMAITANQMNAADVVQETFIKVYKNIKDYDVEKPFEPWFYRILVNESYRYVKKHARTINLSEDVDIAAESNIDFIAEYEDLYQAIQMLDDMYRVPLVLKYLKDLREKDIADILELNINTVKSRLYKARAKLKKIIVDVQGGHRL